MDTIPVLVPFEDEVVFTRAPLRHWGPLKMAEPHAFDFRSFADTPAHYEHLRTIDLFPQELIHDAIRWRGWVYCTQQDEPRLRGAIDLAVAAIFALAWCAGRTRFREPMLAPGDVADHVRAFGFRTEAVSLDIGDTGRRLRIRLGQQASLLDLVNLVDAIQGQARAEVVIVDSAGNEVTSAWPRPSAPKTEIRFRLEVSKDLAAVAEAIKSSLDGIERLVGEARKREIEQLLRQDARSYPAFAVARRAAALALVESVRGVPELLDVGAVRWILKACRIYEDLRGGLRAPSPKAMAFAIPYPTTLGAYERARSFT